MQLTHQTQIQVSVIMPVYNASEYVAKSVASIQAQTFKNWELILIDDCSTDDTCDVIKALAANEPRIRLLFCNQNGGPAKARNYGLKNARGRFIAFLDSDDLWMENKLTLQINFMKSNCLALSYTTYEEVDEMGLSIGIVDAPIKISFKSMLVANWIGCSTVCLDRNIISEDLMTMPLSKRNEDWAMWLKILQSYPSSAMGLSHSLTKYTVRAGSDSSEKLQAFKYNLKMYREIFGYGTIQSFLLILLNVTFLAGKYIYKKIKVTRNAK